MILFIAYGARTQPQGLVDMTAFLRQRGHQAELEHVYGRLSLIGRMEHEPRIVGLSVRTEISGQLRKVVELVRQRWPSAKVAIGGPHICDDVLEKQPELADLADWLVVGEGEYAMLEIAGGREPGIIRGKPLSQEDFARLPMPDAAVITSMFKARPNAVLINRGCPYSCSFCHANRNRLVYRHPGRVVAYLKELDAALPGQKWFIADDIFAVNKRWLSEFADEVQRQNCTVPLRCFINGAVYDGERHELLQRCNVVHCSLGAESADNSVLHLANKSATIEDYRRIDDMFHDTPRMKLHCLWMLGLPGETPQTLKATMCAAEELGTIPPNFGFATPYPGTRFYRMAPEYGRIIRPDWHTWTPSRITFVPHGVTQTALREAMKRGKALGHP